MRHFFFYAQPFLNNQVPRKDIDQSLYCTPYAVHIDGCNNGVETHPLPDDFEDEDAPTVRVV